MKWRRRKWRRRKWSRRKWRNETPGGSLLVF
jgi:hypothetical protein